jgi:hypothetical protein
MLLDFEKTSALIVEGNLLHIAGAEPLLKRLPKGNWIGGSTENFSADDGGKISEKKLSVSVLPFTEYKCNVYDFKSIKYAASDGYDNGFTIMIIPFFSGVYAEFARNAPEYDDMFIKPFVGWVSGTNLAKSGQTPIAVNGFTGECLFDEAVALFIRMPEGERAGVKTVSVFDEVENSRVFHLNN